MTHTAAANRHLNENPLASFGLRNGHGVNQESGSPTERGGWLTGSNPDWDLRIGTVSRLLGSVRSVVGIRLSAELPVKSHFSVCVRRIIPGFRSHAKALPLCFH
jgi:hypothetical protein